MAKGFHFTENGKQLQAIRNKLSGYMAKWSSILGLDRWEVSSEFHLEAPDEWARGQAGECKCDWRYRYAVIGFHIPRFLDREDSELEYTVVHELCHVMVNETRDRKRFPDKMMEHEERVVTELAHAFLRAHGVD